jgi:hypothetical protein
MLYLKILPPLFAGAVLFSAFWACGPRAGSELRFLFNSSAPVSYYDPARVHYPQDYFFLENVYSPLVEYSAGDELVSGLAATFEWSGGEARFGMRPGLRTVDGRPIDAYDAEMSVKRAFILGGMDFDLLRGPLCGAVPPRKLSDPCPGLRVTDGGRTLVMAFEERKPFLFHFLTNIAYAVLPRGSVDPETLAITDRRNTSGPYYVSYDRGGGHWEMRANPGHYRYSPDMPQAARPVPLLKFTLNEDILKMLPEGSIDYLISGLARLPGEKARFAAANPGYNVNITQPVRLVYVVFTRAGMKKLSPRERFFIGGKMRELYLAGREMCEAPDQIFRLEGALSKEQLASVRGLLAGGGDLVIGGKVYANAVSQYFWRDSDSLQRWLPRLEQAGKTGESDFFIESGDIGFQDDVGLASNFMKVEFFDMTPAEKAAWLERYLAAPEKKARMRLLQDLHYRTLASGRVIPIALMAYASVARKPWTFNFPSMFGGDPLWRLRKQ